jgi:peptidoglycan L-alanyl-D-glutamate endopeptidase CwlK
MAWLEIGDAGPSVRRLQAALQDAGFSPGLIDGEFGAGTEAAVMAFQASSGLLVDGIAGPRTLHALKLSKSDELPSALDRFSVQVVAQMFDGAPLSNLREHLPIVLGAMKDAELVDRTMLLMALATVRAETGRFEPIDEDRSRYNSSPRGHPFDLYDHRADLGNRGAPDGERYKGRGYIQLTGRDNYTKYGKRLGRPLAKQPELANDPQCAAQLLALFLGDRELPIKTAVHDGDLRRARKLVNGGSHGLDVFVEAWRIGELLTDDDDV